VHTPASLNVQATREEEEDVGSLSQTLTDLSDASVENSGPLEIFPISPGKDFGHKPEFFQWHGRRLRFLRARIARQFPNDDFFKN
jgi:hypothetical protein